MSLTWFLRIFIDNVKESSRCVVYMMCGRDEEFEIRSDLATKSAKKKATASIFDFAGDILVYLAEARLGARLK